jgi:CubicO group peptidase (beta-lactamase class C family)
VATGGRLKTLYDFENRRTRFEAQPFLSRRGYPIQVLRLRRQPVARQYPHAMRLFPSGRIQAARPRAVLSAFAFGYGATELGGTNSPRADTHFRAASNTKTMTAAVIVLLVQEGKLCFDDPVFEIC